MAPETRDHGDPPPSVVITAIRSLVQDRFGFGPDTGVRLIRSLTNDVYAIDDPRVGRAAVLKVYGPG
ncbi:MAG TPA: hypothetical protein VGT61_10220 [Thermomicrobiales bacterium]|jgi:hypothetical protein|nr:hypothetical protein [Thermomicrobiales bacterium]